MLKRGLATLLVLLAAGFVGGLVVLLKTHKQTNAIEARHLHPATSPHSEPLSFPQAYPFSPNPSPTKPPLTGSGHSDITPPAPTIRPPLLGTTPASPTYTAPDGSAKIVIIIDDVGNQWKRGKRSILLKGDITLAILPFSPYSQQLARLAKANNKEVILHAPMEPIYHRSWKSGLVQTMNRNEVKAALTKMLADVPGAVGVNNHMGSAFTQNALSMSWVMETIAERNLYFVDSRTSPQSRAISIAQQFNVPNNTRDVFLDNERNIKAISAQLQRAVNIAKSKGLAIAIGHPHPETLTVLEQNLGLISQQNVLLVPASSALNLPPTSQSPDQLVALSELQPQPQPLPHSQQK